MSRLLGVVQSVYVTFVFFVLTSPAHAEDSWVGKVIIVKAAGTKIEQKDKAGKAKVVTELTGLDYRVEADEGDLIKVI